MGNTAFERVNNLMEATTPAGSNYTFRFDFTHQLASIDLTNARLELRVYEFGNYRDILIHKDGDLVATGSFTVFIPFYQTASFNGMYVYRLTLTLEDQEVIVPGQGLFRITGGS